jgi:hypothetical protein
LSSNSCNADEELVLRLGGDQINFPFSIGFTNAHGAIPNQNWGNFKHCCKFADVSGNTDNCGDLKCKVAPSGVGCGLKMTTVLRMSDLNNSHFATSTYSNTLCCNLTFKCSDGADNDGDGFIDFDPANNGILNVQPDTGCSSPWDNSENNILVACDDGIDNDVPPDGGIDYRLPGSPLYSTRDMDCTDPTDNDEGAHVPHVINCTSYCTETLDDVDTGICRKSCEGINNCSIGSVFASCDNRPIASSVPVNDTHYGYCCYANETFPNIQASSLLFPGIKDILRSTRIRQTQQGDTVIMNINNFK